MDEARKDRLRQWITTAIVIVANIVAALKFSNIPYRVAQYRPVLLGRYADGHMAGLIIGWLISIAVLVIAWTPRPKRRQRAIGICVATFSILLTIGIFDLILRLFTPPVYIPEGDIYHRQPNQTFTGVTHDVPPQGYSFPNRPATYPDVEYTLTTDARGFRNKKALDKCDVLVLGDSFAEGSEVSDDQAWVSLLSKATGKSFYNLAVAGEDPSSYRETFDQLGQGLQPKKVIVMFYEGNDFRTAREKTRPSFGQRVSRFFKASPLLGASKNALRITLGDTCHLETPVAEDSEFWPIAWLPVGVGPDGQEKYYAFKWKRLRSHLVNEQLFKNCNEFINVCDSLAAIAAKCKAAGVDMVVVYAPDKPHVVLPVAHDQGKLDEDQVAAYLKMRSAKKLPQKGEDCYNTMLKCLDLREQAVAEFCRANKIKFISLTGMLKDKVAAGEQVYFTYDQHWTPLGNEVVARYLQDQAN